MPAMKYEKSTFYLDHSSKSHTSELYHYHLLDKSAVMVLQYFVYSFVWDKK